jgi:uncharacterized membrane protein YfcA
VLPGSALGGFLSSKQNRSFYTLIGGSAFMMLGAGLIFSMDSDQTAPPRLYGYEVLLGFGIGLIFSSTTVVVKLYASLEDAGMSPN